MQFLGIDIGNTAVKAGIFRDDGSLAASASRNHALIHTGPDTAELDPVQILDDITAVIRDCARVSSHVDAIAVSCMAEAFTPLSADLTPWYRCLLTQDLRGTGEAQEFERAFGARSIKEITGQLVNAKFTAPKLRWLSAHLPGEVRASSCFSSWQGLCCILFGFPPYCDYAIAGKTMLFDITRNQWSPPLVEFAGISPGQLDTPVKAGTLLGRLSREKADWFGFSNRPLLVMGSFDQICTNIGSGAVPASEGTLGMGTVFCMVSHLPFSRRSELPAPFPAIPHLTPEYAVSTASVLTAGQAYDWILRACYGGEADPHGAAAQELPASPGGLLFFPYLAGSGTPSVNPRARGAFFGLSLSHTRGALVRAVMEGAAYELRMNLEAIERISPPKRRLIVSGGCSRSNAWLQILGSVLRKDIAVSSVTNAGCLGAAMIAAFGAGRFPSFDAAIREMRGPARSVCGPDPGLAEVYDGLYQVYRSLHPSVMEGSEALANLQRVSGSA